MHNAVHIAAWTSMFLVSWSRSRGATPRSDASLMGWALFEPPVRSSSTTSDAFCSCCVARNPRRDAGRCPAAAVSLVSHTRKLPHARRSKRPGCTSPSTGSCGLPGSPQVTVESSRCMTSQRRSSAEKSPPATTRMMLGGSPRPNSTRFRSLTISLGISAEQASSTRTSPSCGTVLVGWAGWGLC